MMASTSSVYGANTDMPFAETQKADTPMSFYAATKKANEAMAHSYAHLYGIPVTMFRFFTVYGPWGRPDMSPSLFAGSILRGETIKVFNNGKMQRDFTYIEDIVEGVIRVLKSPPKPNKGFEETMPDPACSQAPWRVFNIGNSQPVKLSDFIDELESALGKPATRNLLPAQPGEVDATWADVSDLSEAVGYRPDVLFGLAVTSGFVLYVAGVGDRPRWILRVTGFALFGVAMLTKGPLGLLLPGLVLTLWHGSRREWRRLLELAPLALVSIAVYLPWFIA